MMMDEDDEDEDDDDDGGGGGGNDDKKDHSEEMEISGQKRKEVPSEWFVATKKCVRPPKQPDFLPQTK